MLSRDKILSLTNNGLDIFRHYISSRCRVGKNFHNPLYNDNRASCSLYVNDKGIYKMKDFGNNDYSGDSFFLVGGLNRLDSNKSADFVEIMKIINRDMGLGIDDTPNGSGSNYAKRSQAQFAITPESIEKRKPKSEPRPYTIKTQPIRESELKFWQQYGIPESVLERFQVVSLVEFNSISQEGNKYCIRSSSTSPLFAYIHEKFVKVYRPFAKNRFYYGGEKDEEYCFGLVQLPSKGDMVFITSGEKDVLSLSAKGFNAVCFNSETSGVSENIIQSLYHRFKHIVVLYDMDSTGIKDSNKLVSRFATYNLKRIELPLSGEKCEKDISDYFKIGYTRKDFINLFLTILDSMYSTTMSILKSCEVDFDKPPRQAYEIISAAGVPLGSGGNILCITGGEGTGKSNYVAALIAGCIGDEHSKIDTLGTSVMSNSDHKAILLYDTEQSDVQLHKNVKNLLCRAGRPNDKPKEFKANCLTALSRKERLSTIVESMDRYHFEFGGIHLVVIDGVADLVRCANDEGESVALVDELYRLAGIYNTCIICVLHYIPNGLKLRGHLGSELQRKSAAIISIEKDKNPVVSVVKALKVRDGSPLDVPLMQFSWDKASGMHTYGGEKSQEDKEQRKRVDLSKAVDSIYNEVEHITSTELCEKLQAILDVSERTAKSYIKYLKDNNLIIQDMSNDKYLIKGV
ncbi:MAG: toprim domain-containing protein [Rikenellaceae bacterium]